MKLIADSGSTKTDWRLINAKQDIISFRSEGINPFYMDVSAIASIIKDQVLPHVPEATALKEIYFYGAGCSSASKSEIVSNALQSQFKMADITVSHDLLAAARAVCGNKPGLVAILGTGSNSCLYDGNTIIDNHPSLGFLLGDEGSGAYIGKLILTAYFYKKMPEQVTVSLERKLNLKSAALLSKIYAEKMPNRFMAGLAKWLFQQKDETFKSNILSKAFRDFMNTHIVSYPDYKKHQLHCVGSIAYYFKAHLQLIAEEYDISIGTVLENPIAALALYHSDDENKIMPHHN